MSLSPENFFNRIYVALKRAFPASLRTIWFLTKVTVPITFVVALMRWLGFLDTVALWLDPVMGNLGLPGRASLVLISSAFVNIYAAIALVGQLGLSADMRVLTIVAVFCLIAHSLPVELAIMKRTGSSLFKMLALRVVVALLAAWCLNMVLPGRPELATLPASAMTASMDDSLGSLLPDPAPWPEPPTPSPEPYRDQGTSRYMPMGLAFTLWLGGTARTLFKLALIVTGLMILKMLLDEFGLMVVLSIPFRPLMWLFGLPTDTAVLWILIQVVGYSYGAGILMEEVKEGRLNPREGDLLNHHAAISHSLLEDTVLFATLGVGLFWLIVPRILLAAAVVWLERLRRIMFRRSFRVGTL